MLQNRPPFGSHTGDGQEWLYLVPRRKPSTRTSGLGQTISDKQGHSGKSGRAGGGMGAVVSGLVRNSTMTVGARTGSSALFTLQIE